MSVRILATLILASGTILLASCGRSEPTAAQTAADLTAAADEAARQSAEADAAAAAATREAELALQTSELKAKEAELAAREASLAKTNVSSKPVPPRTASKPATSKPVVFTPPAPKMVTVPSGTEVRLALNSEITSKTAKVGDTFRARVTSDVTNGGQVAIPAGTTVAGKVTKVVSGSDKIASTPTLVLGLDTIEYSGGKTVPISGEYTTTGKSEKGRDAAKIAGGAAAGAVIGHQVNDKDSGTIIGGLLGAAAGTIAAKKTGSEVSLASGTDISMVLSAPLTVQVN